MKDYENFHAFLIGRKQNPSSKGSNFRRGYTRICILLTFTLFSEAVIETFIWPENSGSLLVVCLMSGIALWFFFSVVAAPPFTTGSKINPSRLFADTIVSSLFLICVFALWFRILGLEEDYTPLQAVYFSVVTFSTLGFGDFTPSVYSQPFAAIEAILGNIHLGFIVGATFSATTR